MKRLCFFRCNSPKMTKIVLKLSMFALIKWVCLILKQGKFVSTSFRIKMERAIRARINTTAALSSKPFKLNKWRAAGIGGETVNVCPVNKQRFFFHTLSEPHNTVLSYFQFILACLFNCTSAETRTEPTAPILKLFAFA